MPKTVSVTEARNQLSALLDWAVNNNDAVVIESRGKPKAVIVSYGEYQELLVFREQTRKNEALQS